jgi:hypothetical protein
MVATDRNAVIKRAIAHIDRTDAEALEAQLASTRLSPHLRQDPERLRRTLAKYASADYQDRTVPYGPYRAALQILHAAGAL